MATTAVAAQKLNDVRSLLLSCQKQIAAALPKHMTPERMARIAFTAVQRQPLLLECSQQSLALAVINAAELGLEPNLLGEAYLVPYRDKDKKLQCQLIPGYKGLMKLARNSGLVKSFQVALVREGDFFEYEYGSNHHLKHVPKEDNDNSPITHAWAGAMIDGTFEFSVMTKAELDKIRSTSKAKSDHAPWATHTEEMYKKTVLRRFCKIQPANAEVARAVDLDERAEAGLPQGNDLVDLGIAEEVEASRPPSAESRAKAKLGIKSDKADEPPTIPPLGSDEAAEAVAALSDTQMKVYDDKFKAAMADGMSREDAHETAFAMAVA